MGNVLFKVQLREPKLNRPAIIYDVAALCIPMVVLGAKVGVLLNRAAPSVITLLLLFAVATIVERRMYQNIKKQRKQEQEANSDTNRPKTPPKELPQRQGELNTNIVGTTHELRVETKEVENCDQVEATNKETKDQRHAESIPVRSSHTNGKRQDPKLTTLLQRERRRFPWEYYLTFLLYLGLSFLLEALRGSDGFESIAGIEYCSWGYWLLFVSNLILALIFWGIGIFLVRKADNARKAAEFNEEGEFRVSKEKIPE